MTTAEKFQNYIEKLINKTASINTATDKEAQEIIDIIEASGILTDDEIITITDDDITDDNTEDDSGGTGTDTDTDTDTDTGDDDTGGTTETTKTEIPLEFEPGYIDTAIVFGTDEEQYSNASYALSIRTPENAVIDISQYQNVTITNNVTSKNIESNATYTIRIWFCDETGTEPYYNYDGDCYYDMSEGALYTKANTSDFGNYIRLVVTETTSGASELTNGTEIYDVVSMIGTN